MSGVADEGIQQFTTGFTVSSLNAFVASIRSSTSDTRDAHLLEPLVARLLAAAANGYIDTEAAAAGADNPDAGDDR